MNSNSLINLLEPKPADRYTVANRLFLANHGSGISSAAVEIDSIKKRLKEIRLDTRDQLDIILEELKFNLRKSYPTAKMLYASDNLAAINEIKEIAGDIRIVSTNNSSVVDLELRNNLIEAGFQVINSYQASLNIEKVKEINYWDIPSLHDNNPESTFDLIPQNSIARSSTIGYMAILGVNAISAKEGAIFFLQHLSNIRRDIKEANKVVFIIALDKILRTTEDAKFQTQCMGVYGRENIILSMKPKSEEMLSIDDLNLPITNSEGAFHFIILDNGRSKIATSKYRDLFLCIGCRACNKHCPIRNPLSTDEYIWTPKNYLMQFLTTKNIHGKTLDICLHCEGCRMDCPLDIDLPFLMWEAKKDYSKKLGESFSHRLLGRPEILAKLGTVLAPIANLIMRIKPARAVMERITGIDRRTNLPTFHFNTFRRWHKRHG